MHPGEATECVASGLPRDSDASCVHGPCRRRCCADACVQPLPVIAQDVNGFRSAPPTETDVSNRDWASCEAGAAERRLLLGSATTRECQMGTCKKRPQRDRGPRPAQVPSPCPILFCRHTASAQGPSRRPCLLDGCLLAVAVCSPERGRESATDSAMCGGTGNQTARKTGFGRFPQTAIVRRAYRLVPDSPSRSCGVPRTPQPETPSQVCRTPVKVYRWAGDRRRSGFRRRDRSVRLRPRCEDAAHIAGQRPAAQTCRLSTARQGSASRPPNEPQPGRLL